MKNVNLNKYNVKGDLEKEFTEALKDKKFRKLVNSLKIPKSELIKYTSKLKECVIEKK